ncbi:MULTISPECIES: ribbon-helix-helix protein, CopG family [Cupriavidus]|uniref:CopG family transcriptional regulator n=1 Tax=Cupriavidus oxalaticus TaxID=96344 RepID=A0A4P7LHT4_9BURK|nr:MULTISPECIES: ribbon-helix-helix protein, CopG family [Cupriavidus]MBF6989482.1 CopG family transcriptional regulator [Cupriavidus sp. IK-TO18]QBY55716.1 CopG family transcriptional regulator [Cupriavidus oxalaticus]TDF67379.1 CopG family transcriptional regulator [Cupriavidus sp. L7L]
MEQKTARLTLLIDPNKKAAFERLCAQQDLTASQVIRRFIRDYLAQHGVDYVLSGVDTDKAEAMGKEKSPVGAPSRRVAKPPAKRRAARRGA